MDIPLQRILKKIEHEIQLSLKESNQHQIRDHLLSIRTLCNIVLEQPIEKSEEMITTSKAITPMFTKKKEPVETEDEDGNGESLFDF
ncbi:YwdI family protein [Bacillus salitolerans]|uniref:YwdI family protein n=1 Tax=Bacillus salitolerans TaxID=1437434 RepID=A0ABW4LMB4_9BACI